jgi:transposase
VSDKNIIYVDECGIDKFIFREYAYAPKGQKVFAKISGKKFERTNIVAGICENKWVAPMKYNGTTDSVLFELWFKNCLLKEIPSDSVIILDNASFHRKSEIYRLAESAKCLVLFLPSYSPEYNPIEKKWAWLKKKLRKILPDFDSFETALRSCFL